MARVKTGGGNTLVLQNNNDGFKGCSQHSTSEKGRQTFA